MGTNETAEKEQLPSVPICGICGRLKVKRAGFGGDYECPRCSQPLGIGFGNK